jgi:SAM-dependent methyltransferase
MKKAIFQLARPVRRRSDRIAADLAEAIALLAVEVERSEAQRRNTDGEMEFLREQLRAVTETLFAGLSLGDRLARVETAIAESDGHKDRGHHVVPDSFYWRFESRMRGSQEEVEVKLRQHEALARNHLLSRAGSHSALWLDVGCGQGLFLRILQEWGWRGHGVDTSPAAVEACRSSGIDADIGAAPGCLLQVEETPVAISAIQVIEHLPREEWLVFFQNAHRALPQGGGLLVETINPLNPVALGSAFFADLTHTWPAHPETLRLMAETAGFSTIDLRFLNPDADGKEQDYALWAVKN